MESEKFARLSELTAIARERELTPEEQSERQALRNEYRAAVTGSAAPKCTNICSGKKAKRRAGRVN